MSVLPSPTQETAWLLITTSRSFLLLNPLTGSGFRLDSGRGTYYGITALNGHICVGARRHMESSQAPAGEANGEIIVFDHHLQPAYSLRPPFPLRDMHQIMGFDGRLWVTCTFDNMVAIYDGAHWERWYPRGVPHKDPKDRDHFNSLSVIDGQLCVVANNHGSSELLIFDLPGRTLSQSIQLGVQAHNVWKEGDRWMTCSSSEGRIVASDGFSVLTGGFPRGIARVDNAVYAGISDRAERSQREFSSSCIAIYDLAWNQTGALHLAHEGVVLDLMTFIVIPRMLKLLSEPIEFRLLGNAAPGHVA